MEKYDTNRIFVADKNDWPQVNFKKRQFLEAFYGNDKSLELYVSMLYSSVVDTDPYPGWIRIQWGP